MAAGSCQYEDTGLQTHISIDKLHSPGTASKQFAQTFVLICCVAPPSFQITYKSFWSLLSELSSKKVRSDILRRTSDGLGRKKKVHVTSSAGVKRAIDLWKVGQSAIAIISAEVWLNTGFVPVQALQNKSAALSVAQPWHQQLSPSLFILCTLGKEVALAPPYF